MKSQNWQGVDASLKISLHEYGFIACENEHCEEGELCILCKTHYKDENGNDLFDVAYLRESEINDLVMGKDWMDDEQRESFLSTFSMTLNEWLELPFIHKIGDMLTYWGNEEILGTPYGAIPLDQFTFDIPQECF